MRILISSVLDPFRFYVNVNLAMVLMCKICYYRPLIYSFSIVFLMLHGEKRRESFQVEKNHLNCPIEMRKGF